ncbi:hypothetical protein EJB05_08804, partial [Eragrostis curvula]
MPLVTPGTITPCPTPVSHEATRAGPITRSRAKKIQQEVNSFLASYTLNIDENYVLPKSSMLLLLRFTHEDTSMGHMDDANGYTEDIKNVAEDKHGYKLLTQGYATEASNCHPSLYQSVTSHVSHEATRAGPITRSRAKKIQQEVNSFLASYTLNIDENYVLPKSSMLLLLRFTHEDTSMGHMDDANGYTEDIKNVAQDKHGYKLLTQGYATEASNCHPSLYQSVMSHGTKYTCLER